RAAGHRGGRVARRPACGDRHAADARRRPADPGPVVLAEPVRGAGQPDARRAAPTGGRAHRRPGDPALQHRLDRAGGGRHQPAAAPAGATGAVRGLLQRRTGGHRRAAGDRRQLPVPARPGALAGDTAAAVRAGPRHPAGGQRRAAAGLAGRRVGHRCRRALRLDSPPGASAASDRAGGGPVGLPVRRDGSDAAGAAPAQRHGVALEPPGVRGPGRPAAPAHREPGAAERTDSPRHGGERGVLLRTDPRARRRRPSTVVGRAIPGDRSQPARGRPARAGRRPAVGWRRRPGCAPGPGRAPPARRGRPRRLGHLAGRARPLPVGGGAAGALRADGCALADGERAPVGGAVRAGPSGGTARDDPPVRRARPRRRSGARLATAVTGSSLDYPEEVGTVSDTPAAGAGFGPVEAALLREVGGAAPSIANSQPWRFAVGADRVDVWTDPERSLPAVDPAGRQRLSSCGAAVLNLRLAVANLGFDPLLRLCPTPDDPEHVATVRRGAPVAPTPEDRRLYEMVHWRHTNRADYRPQPLPAPVLRRLVAAVEQESVALRLIDHSTERPAIAALVVRGVEDEAHSPAVR